MTIVYKQKEYRLGIEYVNADITKAYMKPIGDDGRATDVVLAEATVTRHVNDPEVSKAKRRVFAITKLFRQQQLARHERQLAWEKIWTNMKVPHAKAA